MASPVVSVVLSDIRTRFQSYPYKAALCLSRFKYACHISDLEDMSSDMHMFLTIKKRSKKLFMWACEYGLYDGWKMYFDRKTHKPPTYFDDNFLPDVFLVALLRGHVLEEHYHDGFARRV